MHLKFPAISAAVHVSLSVVMLSVVLLNGCKPENIATAPVSPINRTRDRLNPFRFTLVTEPSTPSFNDQIMLKVHVIDGSNQPADGVELSAEVSMPGVNSQHVSFSGTGDGDYEGAVKVEMPGSWDVDLTARRDDKSSKQRLTIEVGG